MARCRLGAWNFWTEEPAEEARVLMAEARLDRCGPWAVGRVEEHLAEAKLDRCGLSAAGLTEEA